MHVFNLISLIPTVQDYAYGHMLPNISPCVWSYAAYSEHYEGNYHFILATDVPKNCSEARKDTLKANKWDTLAIIYLPLP